MTVINPKGRFIGDVSTTWLDSPPKNHRKMVLNQNFGFIDSNGFKWEAIRGTIINGQSFPEWRKNKSFLDNMKVFIGTAFIKIMSWYPYVGNGRRASVLHDYHCQQKAFKAEDVHKMFYDAMLVDGQAKWKADIMYWAVRNFKKW